MSQSGADPEGLRGHLAHLNIKYLALRNSVIYELKLFINAP